MKMCLKKSKFSYLWFWDDRHDRFSDHCTMIVMTVSKTNECINENHSIIYIYIYSYLFSEFHDKTTKDILLPKSELTLPYTWARHVTMSVRVTGSTYKNTARNLFSTGSETQLILCKCYTVYNLGEWMWSEETNCVVIQCSYMVECNYLSLFEFDSSIKSTNNKYLWITQSIH